MRTSFKVTALLLLLAIAALAQLPPPPFPNCDCDNFFIGHCGPWQQGCWVFVQCGSMDTVIFEDLGPCSGGYCTRGRR